MDWRVLTVLVCLFGFFKELRPSEAYLTPYLTGEWKNLTVEQVCERIFYQSKVKHKLHDITLFVLSFFK